jgi:hypothetical protein
VRSLDNFTLACATTMQEASYLLELYRLVEGRVASQCCYYSIHLGMTVPMSLRQTRTCPSELSGPDFVDFARLDVALPCRAVEDLRSDFTTTSDLFLVEPELSRTCGKASQLSCVTAPGSPRQLDQCTPSRIVAQRENGTREFTASLHYPARAIALTDAGWSS